MTEKNPWMKLQRAFVSKELQGNKVLPNMSHNNSQSLLETPVYFRLPSTQKKNSTRESKTRKETFPKHAKMRPGKETTSRWGKEEDHSSSKI